MNGRLAGRIRLQCQRTQFVETVIARDDLVPPSHRTVLYEIAHNGQLRRL